MSINDAICTGQNPDMLPKLVVTWPVTRCDVSINDRNDL